MSDRDDSESSLGKFLKSFTTPFVGTISFISSVYGFFKLFTEKDPQLITRISLIVGILLLLGICWYYARIWKPEKQDRSISAFEPPPSEKEVKQQEKKERKRKLIRRSATAGLILIPFLCWFSYLGWKALQNIPTKDIIVLVADFDSPDAQKDAVTETIINQLRQATEKYPDVKIQPLNKTITEKEGSEVARNHGNKLKASILIWGWYRNTGTALPLSVHFEVLHSPKYFPELPETAKGKLQHPAIADLQNATLQIRLSNEMTYLSLFTLGMIHYQASDLDAAIAAFSNALSQSVEATTALDQSIIYFYRGTVYLEKNDYDRALIDLDRTIELQPKLAEAYGNRSLIYLIKGDYNRSLADTNQAIELNSDFALAYNNRGMVYLIMGDYQRAISDFNQALKLFPDRADSSNTFKDRLDNTIVKRNRESFIFIFNFFNEFSKYLLYVNRGAAYFQKENYDLALADYNQAIKLQPNRVLGYFNRALIYHIKGNHQRAIADYNQVIKLQPNFSLAYMERGIAYFFKEDLDRALADYNQSLKLKPDWIAYGVRCELYQKKGNYDLAIRDCNRSVKLQPDAFTYYARGVTYALNSEYDRAIADYNESLKLKPDLDLTANLYRNRGSVYNHKKDYDRAIADYNESLKLQPDANVYNGRGWAYTQKGKYDLALADVNKALQMKSNEPNFLDTRGYAYAGKKQYDLAITDYNLALKFKPEADYAYYHRGLAYKQKGDKDKAIADFRKTLKLTKDIIRHQDAEKQLRELGIQ